MLGIPAAAFGIGMFEPAVPLVHATAARVLARQWAERGHPVPAQTSLLAGAYLDPIPPGLHAGASSIPSRLPIRPQAWSESIGEPPGWLSAERIGPRAYITLGTVSYGAIGAAVATLVSDGPERAAARRLRDEIAALPAPAVLVDRLVQFAAA